jgi:glycosyltransferase involved in cell wall biosynthesis
MVLMNKKKLLICIDWFDPAYKAGGPVRSIVNLAGHLSTLFDIYIYTSNRDLRETKALENIIPDQWCKHATGANVFYASPANTGKKFVKKMLTDLTPASVYLNSVFSKNFTIDVIRAYRQIRSTAKLVLAPRGMLKPSALATKSVKKKLFLSLAKITGIHKSIHFHVTNGEEAREVKNIFGNCDTIVADNFPAAILSVPVYLEKIPGTIKLILIGRVHPIKNIDFLLSLLKDISGSVQLDIIGVLEDTVYWQQCQSVINELPAGIKVCLLGDMPHHLLTSILTAHHLFVLPTKGENFGHAIAESLSAGRPVLISDQTPWKDINFYKAGWDCSLLSREIFRTALSEAVLWNQQAFENYCQGALSYMRKHQVNNYLIQEYQQLFN